jgi:hypothetical protein
VPGQAAPGSAFRKALEYMLKLWGGLCVFLSTPVVPIDNNHVERQMRAMVLGRKDHYGGKSQRGTEVAAHCAGRHRESSKCGGPVEPFGRSSPNPVPAPTGASLPARTGDGEQLRYVASPTYLITFLRGNGVPTCRVPRGWQALAPGYVRGTATTCSHIAGGAAKDHIDAKDDADEIDEPADTPPRLAGQGHAKIFEIAIALRHRDLQDQSP